MAKYDMNTWEMRFHCMLCYSGNSMKSCFTRGLYVIYLRLSEDNSSICISVLFSGLFIIINSTFFCRPNAPWWTERQTSPVTFCHIYEIECCI